MPRGRRRRAQIRGSRRRLRSAWSGATRRAATATTRCGRRQPVAARLPAVRRRGGSATGLRLLAQLKARYPSSSLLERCGEIVAEFDDDCRANAACRRPVARRRPRPPPVAGRRAAGRVTGAERADAPAASRPVASTGGTVAIRAHHPDAPARRRSASASRWTREIPIHAERLDNPQARVLRPQDARPRRTLVDADAQVPDDVVPRDPAGPASAEHDPHRHGHEGRGRATASSRSTTRIRVVVDFHRTGAPAARGRDPAFCRPRQ